MFYITANVEAVISDTAETTVITAIIIIPCVESRLCIT